MINRRAFLSALMGATLFPVSLAACGKASEETASTEATGSEEAAESSQIANPFIDCESAYEAAQIAGFDVTFPESVPGYSERAYQAIEGEMAQCFYSEGDDQVLIRKGVGTDDISGDYNEYSSTQTATVGDVSVTEKGDGTLVYVATWTKDGYSFAIDADKGLEPSAIEGLVPATM